jgi:hypothetical protein
VRGKWWRAVFNGTFVKKKCYFVRTFSDFLMDFNEKLLNCLMGRKKLDKYVIL